ncbi:Helicase associated domain protein [Streptomyces sp. UH6]|nr:Helicase associated domain protein [Streptomyces sp. UH6]
MTDSFSPWLAGVVRMAPLAGETTMSFVNRLAARYNVTVTGLLSAMAGPGVRGVWGKGCLVGEVFLAPAVRHRLASLCRVPESHLSRALPSWDEGAEAKANGDQPNVRFASGSTVPAVMLGCRLCTAARTGAACSARLYSALRSRICIRHQCWSLDSLALDRVTLVEGQVSLAGLPEVMRAHQRLLPLLRRRGSCENAFAVAQAVVASWWNGPWPVSWRRTYHRALVHVRKHGLVDATAGFPGTSLALGEWLHEQCSRYDDLHVGQQRLLADLGIRPAHARSAHPRRKSLALAFAAGLDYARAFAAVHGHLATSKSTRQDGFPLGQWLMSQRSRARMAEKETDRSRALSAIDPWWNPPWPMAWQRAYHHARKQCGSNQLLVPGDGFARVGAAAASWLYAQRALFEELDPRQQDLLREIGITAEGAQARQTARYHPTGTRIDFAVGLAHARDYGGVHGHLALPHPVQHNGFPLGRWLAGKRGEARAHARRTPAPWPGMQALAALDPWWLPPWAFAWQRDYHRLRLLLAAGLEPPPKLRSWISEQLAQRHTLLPGQQQLLQELKDLPV